MSAKEMFEQLGYKLIFQNQWLIKYENDAQHRIIIDTDEMDFVKEDFYNECDMWIHYDELQAIEKQFKEALEDR